MLKRLLTVAICLLFVLDSYCDSNSKSSNDEEIRRRAIGTWLFEAYANINESQRWEKGYITFQDNGSYIAEATENRDGLRVYRMKWEGVWQVTNSVVTTPTTNTSGFENGSHPKAFTVPFRVVQIDKDRLVYSCDSIYSTTNEFIFYRKKN